MMITRFAPSPTGFLHLGHAFSALMAWRLAQNNSGEFLLRFEDIDHTRVRAHFYPAIEEDLAWLGISWAGPSMRQLTRLSAYQSALEKLRSLGVLYPCFCTRREIEKELADLTHAPHGPEGAHYPGTCRQLTSAEQSRLLTRHEPAWRLDSEKAAALAGELTFFDQKHGQQVVDPRLLGDPILVRRDIGTSYHLAVVVDDAFQEVTHVVRGEDLLHATHLHRLLQRLLDYTEPIYLHHRLVVDEHGNRLAKRDDSLSLQSLRSQGKTPADILNFLPDLANP